MKVWFALLLAGCCRIDFELPRRQADEPPPPGPSVDLGDASFPAKTSAAAAEHAWWTPTLEPQKYRLGYKLGDREASAMLDDYHRWANGVGHRQLDESRFQWRPPKGCLGGLQCVYDELAEEDRAAVDAISERFRRRATDAKLGADAAAALVVSFVQEIDYRVPSEEPFGVMPPALVAKKKEGDCDSKALLAHMLLRSLGIRSVLISSEAHKHTMLGVALPAAGTTFSWDGSRYAFVETTAKRSPIGHVNPELLRPNDWRVVATRSAGSQSSAIRVE
jgi:transglutaminase superfamily protein